MLIFKCDWCGRTISDAQGMGVYTTQLKSLGLPSKSLEILSNGKHICETCMEKAGIMMLDRHAIKEGATTKSKILTLRKAGWRVKEIAEDMHLEPQKISNILYQIRHNKPDKWKAFGLPL